MSLLYNKRILLTGASRGIGLGALKLLLAAGAKVIGTGKDSTRLSALKLEGDFLAVTADLSDPKSADIIASAVQKHWGALDALVNNAAIGDEQGDFEAQDPEIFAKIMQVNVTAPHLLTKALLPFLKKGIEPRIVNVSSGSGQRQTLESHRNDPCYSLSKYSLNGLTKLWHHTLKGRVAVNTMHPGWIRTDMGGPEAPEEAVIGGQRIVDVLEKPFSESGKFWYGKEEMEW